MGNKVFIGPNFEIELKQNKDPNAVLLKDKLNTEFNLAYVYIVYEKMLIELKKKFVRLR